MEPLVLTDPATGSTARVAAHLGFNCYSFQAVVNGQTIDVLDAPEDFAAGNARPSSCGIPLLFPFPNRIREGKYSWDGVDYHMKPEEVAYDSTGNAIHGFCLDRPWRVIEQSEQHVLGQFQLSVDAPERRHLWPADFILEVGYKVEGATLASTVRVKNPDDKPLPWGFGTHAYFRLPLGGDSDAQACLVQAPAAESWELIECLPTGKRQPVTEGQNLQDGARFGDLKLDDVLTGLSYEGDILEAMLMDEAAGLQLTQRCPRVFRELVAFTPPGRNAVCLEPYTCMTDAVNLEQNGIEAGWQTLPAGDEFTTWIDITAGLIVV